MEYQDIVICPACRQERPPDALGYGKALTRQVAGFVQVQHPHWSVDEQVCAQCVADAKSSRFEAMLHQPGEPVSPASDAVLRAVRRDLRMSMNTNESLMRMLGSGDRLAYAVVARVGSWGFSLAVLLLLGAWIAANLLLRPFEPYPIIMLAVISAVLASLAAIQGPIILMSQRRQQARDRLQAENDYLVNLKAELEIQYLHEKIDRLLQLQTANGERSH